MAKPIAPQNFDPQATARALLELFEEQLKSWVDSSKEDAKIPGKIASGELKEDDIEALRITFPIDPEAGRKTLNMLIALRDNNERPSREDIRAGYNLLTQLATSEENDADLVSGSLQTGNYDVSRSDDPLAGEEWKKGMTPEDTEERPRRLIKKNLQNTMGTHQEKYETALRALALYEKLASELGVPLGQDRGGRAAGP